MMAARRSTLFSTAAARRLCTSTQRREPQPAGTSFFRGVFPIMATPFNPDESLDLDGNEMGAEGIDHLVAALGGGGMPSLKILEVDDEDLEQPSLVSACSGRGVTLR